MGDQARAVPTAAAPSICGLHAGPRRGAGGEILSNGKGSVVLMRGLGVGDQAGPVPATTTPSVCGVHAGPRCGPEVG